MASPKSSLVNNNIKEVAMMGFNNKVISYVKVPLVLMIDINTKVNVLKRGQGQFFWFQMNLVPRRPPSRGGERLE